MELKRLTQLTQYVKIFLIFEGVVSSKEWQANTLVYQKHKLGFALNDETRV